MIVTPRHRSGAATNDAAQWRKSSRSVPLDQCVEVRWTDSGIQVRDSKDPDGPRLLIRRPAWTGFITGVPSGPAG